MSILPTAVFAFNNVLDVEQNSDQSTVYFFPRHVGSYHNVRFLFLRLGPSTFSILIPVCLCLISCYAPRTNVSNSIPTCNGPLAATGSYVNSGHIWYVQSLHTAYHYSNTAHRSQHRCSDGHNDDWRHTENHWVRVRFARKSLPSFKTPLESYTTCVWDVQHR